MTWDYLAVDTRDFEYPAEVPVGQSVSQGLSRLGAEGWELVAVQVVDEPVTLYIFKRARA